MTLLQIRKTFLELFSVFFITKFASSYLSGTYKVLKIFVNVEEHYSVDVSVEFYPLFFEKDVYLRFKAFIALV